VQAKDKGKHAILLVADAVAVSSDHARAPVMMIRYYHGNMRRDGSEPGITQPDQPVAEDGGLYGAPGLCRKNGDL